MVRPISKESIENAGRILQGKHPNSLRNLQKGRRGVRGRRVDYERAGRILREGMRKLMNERAEMPKTCPTCGQPWSPSG